MRLKVKYLSTLIFVFISFSVSAQKIPVTFFAGYSNTWMNADSESFNQNQESLHLPTFGLSAELNAGGPFSLITELYFNAKGARIEDRRIRHNFISNNYLLRYTYQLNDLFVYAQGGITYSMRLGTRSNEINNPSFDQDLVDAGELRAEDADLWESMCFGLEGGVGAYYPYGPGSLVLDLRYYSGVMNVAKDIPPGNKMVNRNFNITVGYRIVF
ncbi:MAG: PorT family protein [Cyclobacteriaceae bacterium]|nr:outer membrane beta-barrel protein [Cyclobacteriaceae bacterium]MCH8517415.1 PorT family protein [Cyclobacteriaceae bacterium]